MLIPLVQSVCDKPLSSLDGLMKQFAQSLPPKDSTQAVAPGVGAAAAAAAVASLTPAMSATHSSIVSSAASAK